MTPVRSPLFERLVVTSPNLGGGLGVIDGGCFLFLDGFRSTGICVVGRRLLVGHQPHHVATIEEGRAALLAHRFPDIHDLACIDGTIYAVLTARNEIVAIDRDGSPLRSWRLPGAEDACHVNCLAEWEGRIVFSAFGDFTGAKGYDGHVEGSGYVRDLHSGEHLVDGLTQPHSPTSFRGGLLVADSGTAALHVYDAGLTRIRSIPLGGYVRGIHVGADAVYVGVSRFRRMGDEGPPNARLVALDPDSFAEVARIEFPSAEIYAIAPLPPAMRAIDVIAPLARLARPGAGAAPG